MAKKRANGEGNIRKRKDGRWEGRYTVGHDPVTGKQVFKNVLGKTQAEVKAKLKKAIGDSGKLDFAKTGKCTVGQWMDVWFENYAKRKVRPSSHQTYDRTHFNQGFLSVCTKEPLIVNSVSLMIIYALKTNGSFYRNLLSYPAPDTQHSDR